MTMTGKMTMTKPPEEIFNEFPQLAEKAIAHARSVILKGFIQ